MADKPEKTEKPEKPEKPGKPLEKYDSVPKDFKADDLFISQNRKELMHDIKRVSVLKLGEQ